MHGADLERPSDDAPDARGAPSDARRSAVERAAKAWTGQLIDLGGRNNLLYYRDLRRGTLELTQADSRAFSDLLVGKQVPLSRLFRGEGLEDALPRARTVRSRSREHFEERGLETLFLACGMASWTSSSSSATPAAPVLLHSLTLTPRGAAQEDFDLALTGEAEVNPTLLHLLESEFDCRVDLDGLMARMDGAIDTPGELAEAYRWMSEQAASVPGFTVAERLVVGTFSYAKLPMVKDLEGALDALVAHPIVAALAGDERARDEIRAQNGAGVVDIGDPDRTPVADEFLILDADSSQNFVINAVLAGRNLIVKGPPGTGKSQTIANLISTLVSRGRRVLFVAEKRAAIDAVLGRVERVGLRDLVLDLHGTETRREIARSLADTLHRVGRTPAVVRDGQDRALERRRGELGAYAEALHAAREPWGLSVYEAQCVCLGTPARSRTGVRLRGPELERLNPQEFQDASEDLSDFVSLGGLQMSAGTSPWSLSSITTGEQASRALDLVVQVHQESLPAVRAASGRAAAAAGHLSPSTVGEAADRLGLYEQAAETLAVLKPEALDAESGVLVEPLAPLGSGGLSRAFAGLSGRFREARRSLVALAVETDADQAGLYRALVQAQGQGTRWREVPTAGGAASTVRVASDLDRHRSALDQLQTRLSELATLVPRLNSATTMTFDELNAALDELRGDQSTLTRLPELHRLDEALRGRGLSELLEDCARSDRSADEAVAALSACRAASVLEQVGLTDKTIGSFEAQRHQKAVDEYRAADLDQIESAASRLARRSAEEIIRARDEWPDESALLERQAALKRRHLPLRDLFQAAPNVLLALKPCWAMSPLMVSQVLPSDRPYFDVVVFDEASQVVPADATPAILRGRQLVVAGDEKQLPPTSFFAAQTRDEEIADPDQLLAGTAGFESILDALAAYLPPRTLEWHYRSQDERLIAFSNVHLYDRTLTTFPGIGGDAEVVSHHLVPHDRDATGDSSAAEVQRVVDLMLEHASERPDESLGVIAMGIKHAERIEEQLRRALLEQPELDAYFSEAGPERPFVKNLERVQGDERDAIILTIGYGKGPDGRMLYRFGPLNQEGGERRLNVAVTRARKRLTVVSSFSSADMDPDRTKARGVDLLRLYLAYAETFGRNLGQVATEVPPLNPFESDVKAALAREGIAVDPQVGCSGYRIDFAARHPTQPGRHVLAIECDGASYHSSATARDRDRLRQDHLERLGWRFHRIWSPEWFHHRDRALAKVLDAYRAAVAGAEEEEANGGVKREPDTRNPEPLEPPRGRTLAPDRGPVPIRINRGQSIDEYSRSQLVALVRWINSDTLLRTEDELIQEAMRVLGFQRRGSRITARLQEAIATARTGGPLAR